MPPLQALVALHGLWALALLPLLVRVVRHWPPRRLRLLGVMLTALGVLALGTLVGREALTWLAIVGTENRHYLPQRVLFVLATLTDMPLLQVTFAGVICWIAGHRRGAGPAASSSPAVPNSVA